MSCDLFRRELAEAALSGPRGDVARHLEGCDSCSGELAVLAGVVGEVASVADREPPPIDVSLERLERAVLARRHRRRATLAASIAFAAFAAGAAFFASAWRERATTRVVAPPAPIAVDAIAVDARDLAAVVPETPPETIFARASSGELSTLASSTANDLLDSDADALVARGGLHDEVEQLDPDELERALARFD